MENKEKKRRYKTMKRIEVFEKAMNEGGSLKDYGINSTLFAAYIYDKQYIFKPDRNTCSI